MRLDRCTENVLGGGHLSLQARITLGKETGGLM